MIASVIGQNKPNIFSLSLLLLLIEFNCTKAIFEQFFNSEYKNEPRYPYKKVYGLPLDCGIDAVRMFELCESKAKFIWLVDVEEYVSHFGQSK